MSLTNPKYSERPDQNEQEEAENTQKIPIIKSDKMIEDNSVTISKEATDTSGENVGQSKDGEANGAQNVSVEQPEPGQPNTTSGGKVPGNFSRLPATPRKNIIPSRRASFEADTGPKTPLPPPIATHIDLSEPVPAPQQTLPVEQQTRLDTADAPTDEMPAIDRFFTDDPDRTPRRETLANTGSGPLKFSKDDPDRTPRQAEIRSQASETDRTLTADLETLKLATTKPLEQRPDLPEMPTTPMVAVGVSPARAHAQQATRLTRGRAFFLVMLLSILVINATIVGFSQFFGPQGWGSAFNNSNDGGNPGLLLTQIAKNLKGITPGTNHSATTTPVTPEMIVNELVSNMTLDQKLGQMMLVQFTGSDYSLDLSTMINQYHVGSILIFVANNNVVSKVQLTDLISQTQQGAQSSGAGIPLMVSIDQEGGAVDRLVDLDGPQPSAHDLAASGDTNQAYQQGVKDSQDLNSYGINMNLAPVVDVSNVYNEVTYDHRTFGDNPTTVTQMAGAYLQGLQKSGKVLGTLKHFPGLGDVSVDPHNSPANLTRSLDDLNAIDWAPYKALINRGDVYSIMITHEFVDALDSTLAASISPKVISYLRNQLGFKGVLMTDSLTMDSIKNYYSPGEAAAKAVEAGEDLLMGAYSASDVAEMLDGIKQAYNSGMITQQQIDASVRRVLMLKYQMGLIHL